MWTVLFHMGIGSMKSIHVWGIAYWSESFSSFQTALSNATRKSIFTVCSNAVYRPISMLCSAFETWFDRKMTFSIRYTIFHAVFFLVCLCTSKTNTHRHIHLIIIYTECVLCILYDCNLYGLCNSFRKNVETCISSFSPILLLLLLYYNLFIYSRPNIHCKIDEVIFVSYKIH